MQNDARRPSTAIPRSVTTRAKILEIAVIQQWLMLDEHGYKKKQMAITRDSALPEWFSINLELASQSRARTIFVSLFANAENENEDVLTVILFRIPHKESDDVIEIDKYLEAKGEKDADSKLDLRKTIGPYSKRVETLLGLYAKLFEGDLAKIISGKTWEKGHYTSVM
jgi:hypothetical protein